MCILVIKCALKSGLPSGADRSSFFTLPAFIFYKFDSCKILKEDILFGNCI